MPERWRRIPAEQAQGVAGSGRDPRETAMKAKLRWGRDLSAGFGSAAYSA